MGARTPRRASRGEAIAALSALALLVLMFAVEWFGIDEPSFGQPPRPGVATAEDAWHALTIVRWEMLVAIVVAFAAAAMHAWRPPRLAVALARLALAWLGLLTAVLLAIRVLIDLPDPGEVVDQKLGAVLGLIAALGIAFGGSDAIREQRGRARASHGGASVSL
jgi:hypothetical protein